MRKRSVLPVVVLIACLSAAAQAQDKIPDDAPAISCDGNTFEMVECLKRETAIADGKLNAAYQQALKNAQPKQAEQLRIAQRLWIQYRDANCLYYGLGEGTIARIEAGNCMLSMTESRAKELEGDGPK